MQLCVDLLLLIFWFGGGVVLILLPRLRHLSILLSYSSIADLVTG
jgi:hypothetical protein